MIEFIPREKAESLAYMFPSLLSFILTCPDDARYILVSSDNVLSVSFEIAIAEGDDVIFATDPAIIPQARSFLAQNT